MIINCLRSGLSEARGRNGKFGVRQIEIDSFAWGGVPCVDIRAYSKNPCRTAPLMLSLEKDVAIELAHAILTQTM